MTNRQKEMRLAAEAARAFGVRGRLQSDCLGQVIAGLFRLERTGWVKRGVCGPETVGDHTLSLLALARKGRKTRPDLRFSRLKRLLVVHDFPEAETGDIVTANLPPAEREAKIREKRLLETDAMFRISVRLGKAGSLMFQAWQEFEEGRTREARFARQLDRYQAMLQAWRYERKGNGPSGMAMEFIANGRDRIDDPLISGWIACLVREISA